MCCKFLQAKQSSGLHRFQVGECLSNLQGLDKCCQRTPVVRILLRMPMIFLVRLSLAMTEVTSKDK